MLLQLIVVLQFFIIQGGKRVFQIFVFLQCLYYLSAYMFMMSRASPSEFVIPLSKYIKAVFHTRVSVGMRFRMLFETEESSVRRYHSFSWLTTILVLLT